MGGVIEDLSFEEVKCMINRDFWKRRSKKIMSSLCIIRKDRRKTLSNQSDKVKSFVDNLMFELILL